MQLVVYCALRATSQWDKNWTSTGARNNSHERSLTACQFISGYSEPYSTFSTYSSSHNAVAARRTLVSRLSLFSLASEGTNLAVNTFFTLEEKATTRTKTKKTCLRSETGTISYFPCHQVTTHRHAQEQAGILFMKDYQNLQLDLEDQSLQWHQVDRKDPVESTNISINVSAAMRTTLKAYFSAQGHKKAFLICQHATHSVCNARKSHKGWPLWTP